MAREMTRIRPAVEGAYMERGRREAFAVRKRDGSIAVRVQRAKGRTVWEDIPLIRGVWRIIHCTQRTIHIFTVSERMRPQQLTRPSQESASMARALGLPRLSLTAARCTLVALLYAVGFWVLPMLLELLILSWSAPLRAIILIVTRIGLMLLSVYSLSRIKFLRRLSMLRGAANKVQDCVRTRQPITIESALTGRRVSPESDGAFALLAVMLFIILATILPMDTADILIRVISRLLLILLIFAVLNEILRPIEQSKSERAHRLLDRLQLLYTTEPHSEMLEVAITAYLAARGELQG